MKWYHKIHKYYLEENAMLKNEIVKLKRKNEEYSNVIKRDI